MTSQATAIYKLPEGTVRTELRAKVWNVITRTQNHYPRGWSCPRKRWSRRGTSWRGRCPRGDSSRTAAPRSAVYKGDRRPATSAAEEWSSSTPPGTAKWRTPPTPTWRTRDTSGTRRPPGCGSRVRAGGPWPRPRGRYWSALARHDECAGADCVPRLRTTAGSRLTRLRVG